MSESKVEFDQRSSFVLRMPLWRLRELDLNYLKYEIERAVREFGYEQVQRQAVMYGRPEVIVRLELTQPWTLDETRYE